MQLTFPSLRWLLRSRSSNWAHSLRCEHPGCETLEPRLLLAFTTPIITEAGGTVKLLDIIDGVLTCLFADGHALLEGVPGLGKTLLIRSLAEALHLRFSRIQFTPDLMPADVTGTTIVVEGDQGRQFEFRRGPIFAQIVLADEINRATPKTQSAMLEAMQEHSVTVGDETYKLEPPFFVMATQNPIEQEGTYPLPEAQLDRFFFKLEVGYSSRDELSEILNRTTTGHQATITPVLDGPTILKHQKIVRKVVIAEQQVTVLAGEAEACIGEELVFLGPTEVEVDEPDHPDDPTGPEPEIEIEDPGYASPFL